ncbi:LCCL domain containing protein [Colletotrichum tofieldiae]|uniref:LCCL domain containing protein n=1 Tax=Colletotrichum tofieldiae TaxID=708197 RepID=A0A166YZW5_9PEZI|nr:LCCL domain containing protein [Colletotrichum tofieldiae]GKT57585.1 LCCL domain containing protein [Colletotrichum tofieldiae]GKT77152.1 LCCL domain containing protein [Colletotrichum tofieldiae]
MGAAGDGFPLRDRPFKDSEDDDADDKYAPRRGVDEEAQFLADEEYELEESTSSRPSLSQQKFPHTPKRHCLAGPQPPRVHTIRPILPIVQEAPPRLLDLVAPTTRRKGGIVAVFLALWAIAFSVPLASSRAMKDGFGQDVISLDCSDTLWRFKNGCGLDGADCRPFTNSSFSFKCPANCMAHKLLNPHAVGPQEIVYKPLVVGDGMYRGDSMICASAIHAGIVTDLGGGCGRLHRTGRQEGFNSSARNGVDTVSFDSYFPLSFNLSADSSLQCGKRDPRQVLLPTSMFFTTIFSLFTTSPAWQFFVSFIGIFAHVSFGSDPPTASRHAASVLPDRISMFTGRLLPATFCAVVLYWTCARRTLADLRAQFEKTVLWLGGFWFGALSNYTFGWMPIQRLTAHDIEQQPGAKPALALILIILAFVMAKQVYFFWLEGRLPRFLALYALFLAGIIIGLSIPGVDLRVHHYIMAFLLLPGTSMQTRTSLFYQGMLLGLFVNGIARWGFDSVLQTPDELREDGAFNSLLPEIAKPVISSNSFEPSISFSWILPPNAADFDGVSALVNDVERFRYYFADGPDDNIFVWMRKAKMALPEYFRFAYMKDGVTLDYTQAGTWFANGTWALPAH